MLFKLDPRNTQQRSRSMRCVTTDNSVFWLLALLCLLLGGGMSGNGQLQAAEITQKQMLSQPEKIPDWIAKKKIQFKQIPNPHWKNNDCTACHRKIPTGKNLHLRGKSVDQLCEYCHSGEFDHSYIHPNAVPLPVDMQKRIPKGFSDHLDTKKRVSCDTCHEIEMQCLKNRRNEQQINPMFFREGPYKIRSDLCYKCHDVSAYQRKNAHDQKGDDGKIKQYTCLICHDKTKGLETAGSIREVGFHIKGNLVRICASCHELKPHPSGSFTFTSKGVPNHLVVPPKEIREKMLQSEKEHDVILPLDPNTGKVFCGTCHNPHEKGVIKNESAAKGADEKNRLRTQNICTKCHDK